MRATTTISLACILASGLPLFGCAQRCPCAVANASADDSSGSEAVFPDAKVATVLVTEHDGVSFKLDGCHHANRNEVECEGSGVSPNQDRNANMYFPQAIDDRGNKYGVKVRVAGEAMGSRGTPQLLADTH